MSEKKDLKLDYMAVGSLPHKSLDKAMELINTNFKIPFWPQLAKFNKNEDMIFQYLEKITNLIYYIQV